MTQDGTETESIYTSPLEVYVVFFLVFMGVLTLTYGFFFAIDFLPETPAPQVQDGQLVAATEEAHPADAKKSAENIDPYPTKIILDALDREVAVVNPESRSVTALDNALLTGVVRHPDSADFKTEGTIFLFGHSSYLPNVINKNFQAFNGIQKLSWGDTIRLQSSDADYVYSVDRVYKASANDATVKIEMGKPKLTLVTCDSFGSKSDRFVVEATLIETKPLTENDI